MGKSTAERTSITLSREALWKLKEAKVMLRCETWDEFAEKINDLVKRYYGG